jgi:uncharacterized protein
MTKPRDLAAGVFSSWLQRMRAALAEEDEADVPCSGCSACCASSHFVHVRPEETQTLARIPRELLFKAPGLPEGTMILGYDQNGHCPMLVGGKCSIYEHRPLTCRTYDCRVFAAARIAADKHLISQRTRRWKFTYLTQDDRDQHAAVQAAARFLRDRADHFPDGAAPRDPVQVAVLAVKVSDVFLEADNASAKTGRAVPDHEIAAAVMKASQSFEARRDGGRALSAQERG